MGGRVQPSDLLPPSAFHHHSSIGRRRDFCGPHSERTSECSMTLWEEFISLEATSSSLVPTLKALLSSREELKAIYKLTGLEAQRVVDSINQVCNPSPTERQVNRHSLYRQSTPHS